MENALGFPCAVDISSSASHEVTLAEDVIENCFEHKLPEHLISDKIYNSDPLNARLLCGGIDLIASHWRDRRRITQDGGKLRRYQRRWKDECL